MLCRIVQFSALVLRVNHSRPGYIPSHSNLMVRIILHATVSRQVGLSDQVLGVLAVLLLLLHLVLIAH